MRFPMSISGVMRLPFRLFGVRPESAYLELDDDGLQAHFGRIHERIPLDAITGVTPRDWPFYNGLGNKFGPDRGVAWVGSFGGVVRIDFAAPRPIAVWGPLRAERAQCLIISLEDPEGFIAAVERARSIDPSMREG